MDDDTDHDRQQEAGWQPGRTTACEANGCRDGRAPGHRMHRIQLGLVDGSPWAWRAGVVRSTSLDPAGHSVVVHCTESGADVTVRHHVLLPLAPGTVVAVHERGSTLEVGEQWRSVSVVDGGLGVVAKPDRPTSWPRRRRGTPDSVAAYFPG